MKIAMDLCGPLRGLVNGFQNQGDHVQQDPANADLVLWEDLEINLGLVYAEQGNPTDDITHTVTRWFWNGSFLPQTFVGFPLIGLMDEGRGAQVPTGIVGRFVETRYFSHVFEQRGVEAFLKELDYHGPVTFRFHWNDVVGLQTGIPFWGVYAIAERIDGRKLSEWFSDPTTKLFETWTAAVLVSRHPYPAIQRTDGVSVVGVQGEPRVWMLGGKEWKGVWKIDETEVCIVTGSVGHGSVHDIGRMVRKLCDQIVVEGVQYRTDLQEVARERIATLREKGII